VILSHKPEGDPRPSLFTLDVETRELELLLPRPPDVYLDTRLTYSPDGLSFVFIRNHGSKTQELCSARPPYVSPPPGNSSTARKASNDVPYAFTGAS
jgi:hypothetical protein